MNKYFVPHHKIKSGLIMTVILNILFKTPPLEPDCQLFGQLSRFGRVAGGTFYFEDFGGFAAVQ
jgi:hypothetical protein